MFARVRVLLFTQQPTTTRHLLSGDPPPDRHTTLGGWGVCAEPVGTVVSFPTPGGRRQRSREWTRMKYLCFILIVAIVPGVIAVEQPVSVTFIDYPGYLDYHRVDGYQQRVLLIHLRGPPRR